MSVSQENIDIPEKGNPKSEKMKKYFEESQASRKKIC
jgi:hypothetical protein